MEIVIIVLVIACILGIMGVSYYIYVQMEATKKFVREELIKFTTSINDAQYNEFKFDKLNEQNIKNMEKRIKDMDAKLKTINDTLTKQQTNEQTT